MAADAAVIFDIALDLGKIKTAVNDAAKKVNREFTKAFSEAAKKSQTSCDEMAKAFKKVSPEIDETRAKIDAILNNADKSMKSKAASIAGIYRKQGMSLSEAMEKAWSEIERTSGPSSDNVKQHIKGIGSQGNATANGLVSNFTKAFKKAGVALASAFAVKKIWDFGAACVELGSDLQEVQNVVDVTFLQMSKQVDDFAKNAAVQFGLSETMAKKFTGTFGAMAKAFGFNEQSAYEMSTALTGLAGDVASFYNMSQDEAFTKLKSVFTGETESLKDLGVVMTQTALDQYALANGFGKTTAAMSEAEKVALRYQFVTDQLSLASGDFVRTSDGWANQVRVLKLQFESLQAAIGQGLINVLTPVIKVINTIIGKLMSLANASKSFTEMLTGKKSGGGASVAAAGMEAVADSADNASAAIGGTGGAAKKAAKEIKCATTGIDEFNIIDQGDSGSGGSGGGAGGGYQEDQFDMGEIAPLDDEVDARYQALIDRVKELQGLFKEGFQAGFGDLSVLDSIQDSISSIGESLREIFTDPEVVAAANAMFDSIALNAGKIAGSMLSVGASIADNLLGGVSRYLKQNTPQIKNYLISMFNLEDRMADISGNFSSAVAVIGEAFRSDSSKQITADIIGIFSSAFMGVTELAGNFGADVLNVITQPFIDNQELIRQTLENTFSAVEPVLGSVKELVDETFEALKNAYDTSVGPLFQSFASGLSAIGTRVLELYNQYILPVATNISEQFVTLKDQYLSPLIEKFGEFASKVAECVTAIWENALQPFILWFMENVAPIIASDLQEVSDIFFWLLEQVSTVLDSVLDALNGLLDFLTGVFTGDWKKAWTGIKTFLSSIWEMMKSLVQAAIEAISVVIASVLAAIQNGWNSIWTGIKDFAAGIWQAIRDTIGSLIDAIHTKISSVMDTIKTAISTALENVKKAWNDTWDNLKQKTEDIFEGIWSTIKGIINKILGGIEKMANGVVKAINKMIEAVNDVADHVPGIDDSLIPTIPELHLPRLAQGGFVKANTPQLAMIGDNRHYGEIVAPEDKMQEMVNRAAAMAAGMNSGMSDQYLLTMIELLQRIIELIENLDLTVNIDIREIKKKLVDLEKRSGYTLRTT